MIETAETGRSKKMSLFGTRSPNHQYLKIVKTSFLFLLLTFVLQAISNAAPKGICLHAYGPDAPADKIECFEFEKIETYDGETRYYQKNGQPVLITPYRNRGVILYPGDTSDPAKTLEIYEALAKQTPSTRQFLNPWILKLRANLAESSKQSDEIAKRPTITLPDGTVLKGCQATKIAGSLVTIVHTDGIKKISITDLSAATQTALDLSSLKNTEPVPAAAPANETKPDEAPAKSEALEILQSKSKQTPDENPPPIAKQPPPPPQTPTGNDPFAGGFVLPGEELSAVHPEKDPIRKNDPATQTDTRLNTQPSETGNVNDTGRLSFLLTADELSALYGLESRKAVGNYQVIKYEAPVFRWSHSTGISSKESPSYCRGAQITAVFGGSNSKLIAYQYDFPLLLCQVANAGPKLEWRNLTEEDDLRRIMHAITPLLFSPSPDKFSPKRKRKDVDLSNFATSNLIQRHRGLEAYANSDESVAVVLDFGTTISDKREAKPKDNWGGISICVSTPAALAFHQKYGFNLSSIKTAAAMKSEETQSDGTSPSTKEVELHFPDQPIKGNLLKRGFESLSNILINPRNAFISLFLIAACSIFAIRQLRNKKSKHEKSGSKHTPSSQKEEVLTSTTLIKFNCAHCSAKISATSEQFGLATNCPSCGRNLVVPVGAAPTIDPPLQPPSTPSAFGNLPPVPGRHTATYSKTRKKILKIGVGVFAAVAVIVVISLDYESNTDFSDPGGINSHSGDRNVNELLRSLEKCQISYRDTAGSNYHPIMRIMEQPNNGSSMMMYLGNMMQKGYPEKLEDSKRELDHAKKIFSVISKQRGFSERQNEYFQSYVWQLDLNHKFLTSTEPLEYLEKWLYNYPHVEACYTSVIDQLSEL